MAIAALQPAQISSPYQSYLGSPYQSYPDTEVLEKPVRRRFTTEYKLYILQEADTCNQRGQIGALLRREGLSFSNLTAWRRQREQGQLQALTDNKRGRKAKIPHPLQAENEHLRQENQQLAKRLKQAELMLGVQKKASEILLGGPLKCIGRDESD